MQKPIVIGYHLIWTAYGYWLPNDPRGSMSKTIACDVIAELGALHYGRKKVQPSARAVGEFRDRAKDVLKYSLLDFSPSDFSTIAEGLAQCIREQRYTCYACAIMPDHVHLVTGRHRSTVEYVAGFLKRAGTRQLNAAGLHPLADYRRADGRVPSPWVEDGWFVYLNTPEQIRQRIGYVQENPVKEGLPRQQWPFVVPYEP